MTDTPPDHEDACRHLRAASRRQGSTTMAAYALYRAVHASAPSSSVVVRGFDSWSAAIRAAGLRPSPRGRPTGAVLFPDELVAGLLRQCAEQIGHPPSVREYERWRAEMAGLLRIRIPGSAILRRRYGGWGRALAAADLSPRS